MERVVERYTKFLDYLNESGEVISYEEWCLEGEGKLREFEPTVLKYMKFGIAGILGVGILSRVTVGLYRAYRMRSDACVKACGGVHAVNRKCYNTCYAQAAKQVMNMLQRDFSQLGKIRDIGERRRVERRLKREYKKWEKRYNTYKLRARTAPREVAIVRGKKKRTKK